MDELTKHNIIKSIFYKGGFLNAAPFQRYKQRQQNVNKKKYMLTYFPILEKDFQNYLKLQF